MLGRVLMNSCGLREGLSFGIMHACPNRSDVKYKNSGRIHLFWKRATEGEKEHMGR